MEPAKNDGPLLDQIEAEEENSELQYSDFMDAFRRHKSIISKAFISNVLDYIVVPAIMFSLIVNIFKISDYFLTKVSPKKVQIFQ